MNRAILKYIEKRIFRRLDAEIPVDLEYCGKILQATTLNISCGGLFLKVPYEELAIPEAEASDPVNMVIYLPNRHTPVKLVGEIRRSEDGPDFGVGVEFQGLYNDNILAIERFVKTRLN